MSTEPTFPQLISEAIDSRQAEIYTALPGEVVTYDPATRTCTARVAVKRPIPDEEGEIAYESHPDIPNVPVYFPRSSTFEIAFDLAPGDGLLLIFSGLSPTEWRATGLAPSEPGDVRTHSPAYPIALAGWFPTTKPSTALPGDPSIGRPLPDLARLSFTPNVAKVGAGSDFVAMAARVATELAAIRAAFNAHVHTGVTTGPGSSGPPETPMSASGSVASTNLKAV